MVVASRKFDTYECVYVHIKNERLFERLIARLREEEEPSIVDERWFFRRCREWFRVAGGVTYADMKYRLVGIDDHMRLDLTPQHQSILPKDDSGLWDCSNLNTLQAEG